MNWHPVACQEHAERPLSTDGLKASDIYAQYGLTAGRRSCWQWMHAEGEHPGLPLCPGCALLALACSCWQCMCAEAVVATAL